MFSLSNLRATAAPHGRRELDGERFDLALLDHDLGKECETGMSVVAHIVAMEPERRPAQVLVHSDNTGAAPEMVAKLRAVGVDAMWVRLERDRVAGARIVRR